MDYKQTTRVVSNKLSSQFWYKVSEDPSRANKKHRCPRQHDCSSAVPGNRVKNEPFFLCTRVLNTPQGPGHPHKIPGTSQGQDLLPCMSKGGNKLSREGRTFQPPQLGVEDPCPTGRSPGPKMGSQHPSPNMKKLCNFEPQIWPEIITSRDAHSLCFKGFKKSCDVKHGETV